MGLRTYIPRRRWATRRPSFYVMPTPKPLVVVHHTADGGPPGGAKATGAQEITYLRSVENFHVESRGMLAIAYSFVVMPSGRVYEGRGWGKVGGHTENYNSTSHGICFAGNFETQKPTSAALKGARRLIERGRLRRKIAKAIRILGHGETKPTACPGKNLRNRLAYLLP